MHRVGRQVTQGLVKPFHIVELEIVRQAQQQLGHAGIAFQVHVLVLDAAPEALHEDVVQGPPAPVHADVDAMPLENPGERLRGELATLVAVEDFRDAVGPQGLPQAIDAKPAVQCVRDPPGQHLARVPVDHRHQIREPVRQPDVGDVGTPGLVGPVNLHPPQQVGVDLVLRVRAAGVRARRHARQPQHPHQPLHPLAVDPVAHLPQVDRHLAAAVERMPGVLRVNQCQQGQRPGVRFRPPARRVDRGTGNPGQFALAGQRQRPVRIDPALAVA